MLRCKNLYSTAFHSLLLVFTLLILGSQEAKATHATGTDLTYICIGPNQYAITLNVYRDCNGINLPANQTVSWTGSCGSGSINASRSVEQDITPVCPGGQSSCNNGSGTFGVEQHTYTSVVTLPPGCTNVIFSWRLCCRNNAITTLNGPGSERMYVESFMSNTTTPCNNSPIFLNPPTSFTCRNNAVFYNHGATDFDGDSLSFSLTDCLDNAGVSVNYAAGHSGAAPFGPGIPVNIDPGTGAITFTPNIALVGVLCVLVEEYRNGILIGSIVRDIQFRVINCNNTSPVLSGVNGAGIDSIDFVTSACFGTQLCFDVIGSDPSNPGDVLTMTYDNAIPSATFVVSGPGVPSGNQVTGTFCWTPTIFDLGTHTFTITIQDDACPIVGSNTFTYVINVVTNPNDPVFAGTDVSICQGDTAFLNATTTSPNAVSYSWSPALGLSNPNIPNPEAKPPSTTCYTVTLQYNDGCFSTDFVCVTVEDDPPLALSPNGINACGGSSLTLSATTDALGANFTFTELFGSFSVVPNSVTGVTASAPITMPTTPGSYRWEVEVVNPITSCSTIDIITLTVGVIPTQPACRNIYASTTGSASAAGNQFDPVTLEEALARSACNLSVIKVATGTYNIDDPLNITSLLTLEGGFIESQSWLKTSEIGATTINRTKANARGVLNSTRNLTALEVFGSTGFRLQDLTITTDDALVPGTSTYGIYMNFASDYNITRCNIVPGAAADGTAGGTSCILPSISKDGANGVAGAIGDPDVVNDNIAGGGGGLAGLSCGSAALYIPGRGGDNADPSGCGIGTGCDGQGPSVGIGVVDGGAGGGGGRAGFGSTLAGSGGDGAGGGTPLNPPFSGCSATATGVGSAATGGAGNGFSNPSNNGVFFPLPLVGTSGTTGIDGVDGCVGSAGPSSQAICIYTVGVQAGTGMSGSGGSGGGGGGGGAGQQGVTAGTGGAGGGGGGGGAGGFGGTGGYGGGGSFGIYMCDNGANGFIEDCFVVAGSPGAGGIGGAGQTGGAGGTGGIGGAPSSTDVGAGGNGGNGGQGGAGGQGGSGSNGLAIDIFCFSCTSQPVVQDSIFQLFNQQIIFVENTNCTNAQVMFYDSGQVAAHPLTTTVGSGVTIGTPGASVTNWTYDAINGFAQPPTGTFNADTTRYDSIGRFTILHNEQGIALQEYTGFHNIAFDKSFKPDILSSANVLGPDTFQLCLGDFATFSSSIFGDTTRWEFNGAITNPGNVQFVPSTQFNVSGFFMVQLFLITDCCGDTPIDTAYIYVDPVPAVTGSGPEVICAGGNVNLAVFGLSPNDTVIWTPAINLGIISLDSANVSPTVTRTYKASVYTIITSGSQTRLSCPVALPYDITINPLPNPVMSSTNVVCSNDGTATATPPAGLYDFVWSDGSITSSAASSTINNLPTGSYCVTVTDLSSGCIDTGCIFVNPAVNLPALNVSTTPITCFGDNDGVATISTTGGTTTAVGYTYAISPAVPVVPNPSLTPVTLTGLAPGNYSVTSTDEIGCVTTLNFDITTPQPLILNVIDTLNPVCQSTFDGRIEVEGQGGTGLLTYSWSNGVVTADSGILSGIDTGLYCVTVVDDNNCSAVFCHTLRPQQVLSTSLAVSAIPCNGGTACITVNAVGGSNAYAYDWSGPAAPTPFSTGNDVSCGFPASTSLYTVLITDSTFSCTTTASVSITEPSALSATIASQTDVNCFGDSTGIASAGASGGTPGYSYLWNYGTNETNVALDSLPDGVYTVTVTDATGVCTTTETVTITEPATAVDVTAAISSNFNGQQVSCFGATDGEATATASGGTPASTGYDFQWDANAANQNTPIAVGLSVANNPYVVVVTDSLNCTDTDTIAFAQPSAVTATVSSSISVSCFGDSSGQATIAASGGTAPYNFLWSDGQSTLTGVGLQVANNPYCVTVTDNNGCSDVLCFNIAQPAAPITSSISVIADPSCFGGSDGSVFATASGGTGITTYLWGGGLATGQTNDTITGLPDGQYCVTISDANLCTTVECVTLTQPSQVTATISATQAIDCFGDSSGTATVSGSGGTLPGYGITWDNGQSTVQATGLVANIPHCVTITDNNGCPASTCITLTQSASAITVGATVISNYNGADLSCAGATDACVQANAANGTPFAVGDAYTYNWAPSASNDDSLCAVGAGVYAVTVTDSLGCQASATVTVGSPTALTASIISTTNVLCFGDSTGCADVATAGGTGTVTYLWPDGLTTAQNCNLFNGSHTVTVSDANGCTVTATAIINQPALPLTLASVVVDSTVKCNAGNDGGITANPSGGSGSYNFSWSNSATTATLTGLTQGTYCVTLTDVPNGCIDTACIQMTQPSAVTATITSQVNVNCFGAATGSATAAGSGGTALNPYTFVWDANAAGQSTATATGLIAGLQYCVTVSDDNGCFDVVCVTLTQPSAILSTTAAVAVNPAYNGSDVSCTGASDGMVVAAGIDGAGGYSYDWGSGNSNDTLSNVAAGVYCVTVTDANACIATACATVTDPVALTTSINAIDVTNINCAGDSTGTALVTVTGGNLTVPYAYQWDNGLTTQQGTNLLAGQQCVSVTDANGCISVACVSITEPASTIVIAGITVDSNVSCNGLSDGGATAVITGGTPALGGYDFAWSGNGSTGQTTASITGLAAGAHCLIVTDSLLCVDTLCVTISEPVSVSANIDLSTAVNINCFGDSTGQATATATGGSGVYTFLWDANANNQNTATATGLQAGISYCVTVTDNNGCVSDSACVTLTQPASAINASAVELTQVSCNAGADGAVQVTASGGTAAGSAYTFLWGTNAGSVTTPTVNGLSVANGPYCVTATDALGCTDTSCATLTEPLILNVTTASITNILCNGDSLGEITLAVTGGTAGTGYTYQWDAAADSATTQVVVGLPAGVFCATVNDANNCSASVCVTLTEPTTAVDVTATVNSNFNGSAIQCFGDSSGTALAVATGGAPGVGGYTFSWSLTSQTTALATGLPDGTFVVTAIDSVGCLDTAIVTLVDPTQVVASTTVNNTVSCLGGCDGEATVSAVGGVAGYTVLWDAAAANQTTATATGLCQGLYGVTISDANGCSSSATVNITQPSTAVTASALVTSSYNGQDISCNNAFDGIACGSAVGGTPDYTYLWGGGVASGATTQCVSGLNAGTYSVTVSDSLGCSAFNTVTLTEPSAVTPSAISTVDVSCFGDSTGAATVQGIGGLAPYNFQWEAAADSQQTATATGLAAGSYLVTVLDANGCQGVDVVVVGQPSGALNVTTSVLSSFPGGTAMQCFGDSSGQATVNVSGGSPIYNIIWDIGSQTTNTITGLSDGTYCVTVTDAQGCSDTACVTLVQPLLLTATTTSDSALCNGGNTGSATVVASGGTGAGSYLYQWDASALGQNTATANGLAAGLYNVTVIDANGCQTVVAATVNQPATGVNVGLVITSNYNGQDVSCNGAIDAIVNASATGGSVVGNYNYVWSNGTVDNPLDTVGAGQHCVIVTDDNGCSATDCITVTQPSAITATIVASTSVTCFNTCTGSATVAGAGGTAIPGYSYQWDTAAGSQTTAVAIGLCVGSYNVTVIDGNGCFAVASVIITQPTAPLTTALNVTSNYNGQQLSCAGASDAEITATVTGGDGSYTISWNNSSSTTNVAAALSAAANPHCVFIVDGLGCTDTACINLVPPTAVTCSIVATTPISCNGGSNGSATVNPGGGTGGFSFIWDDGQTTATAVGLSAGPICVTITDANGCAATACTNLSDPAALSLTATINSNYNGSNVSCAGACDGIVFATALGGTQPYQSYTWSTSGAGITDTITLACAGTVDVTVTDANGCIAVATTVTLTEPSAITATITASADASCNGQCDGTATVTAAGGTLTTGYTFLWSASAGAQTTASATGLCSGTHNVTVTDNNNCNAVTSVFIDQPLLGVSATAVVSSNFNAADVSCFGACDGEATATGAGGTLISGYTFQWDIAAAAQTTSIASGLCAGVYSVTVSDNGGCSNVANVTLTDPSQLSTTIVSTVSVSCGGGNDGQATVSASGGTLTTGYTYLWDASGNGQTTTTATGLPGDVGINVSVTDNNGCVSVATVTITQPANALFVNPVVVSDFNGQAISCNGACDAIVAVQTAGGIPGYSINWNTAATTDTLSNLCPGTYVVTVTDNGNCTIVDSVVVTEPVVLSASISSQNNVSCTGGNDACVTIQGAGGTAGYSYSIVSGVTQANNGLFCNLTAGNYSVTVSDLNFCTTTVSVTITEPTALPTVTAAVSSDYLGQDISCFGACDADVTATATAGTAPYTYNWSMTTQNTATVTGICAGVFSVIITDSLGCTASASVTVVEPTQLVGQLTATTDVACFGDSTGTASFSASGGIAPYTYNNGLSSTTTLSTTATLLNIPAGAYLTTITDGNGCSVLVPFAITSPPVLTNTASVTSSYANGTVISCNGLCDGAATAVGTGGNPGSTYNFLWSASANSQTSFTATGLCAGTHSVTITDQNGCSAIDSVTLNEPIQLAATSSGTGIDCFGGTTGSVQVNAVTGTGTPNYTYTLGSVTNSTGLFSNLGIGTYCVTITDGNNCSIVECVTLSQNTLVVASAFVSSNYNGAQTSCQNSSDGEATVNVTGGVAPYAFLWSTGASNQTSQTAVGLAAGTYVVTVTDVFGCNDTDTVIIVSPDSVILDVIDTVHITCFGQPTGSFTVAASGGVGPYTYSFDGGVTFTNQVQYTNLPANSVGSGYCVIVQDANGCQTTTCVTINEPTQLQGLADSITMVSCFGGADGVIAVSGVGGTPPYGYSFNGGLSTSTNVFNGLIAGNYTVVITDSEACQTTMSNLIVTQPPVLILTVDTTRNPSCTGDCDGVIQVTASQGSGGFEYSIDGINYQATGNFTNLCAGGYTLFVRDVQGCITSIPVTLSQPTFVLANATVTSDYNGFDVTCNTACDGAATATPSGGTSFSTGLYLYQWSVLGSTTQSVTGLCANTLYTVTVIDANGCTDVDSVILTEPTPVDANYVQVTNESCFGNDGVIAVTAVIGSGVGPYTYDIGTGSSASGTFTGLTGTAVGTPYSVTITDANNCTTVLDTFLTLPAVLDITDISVTSNFNGQDISCFGAADGAATIAHTGGNAPISYLWDISTGAQTTITANGLRAGTYAVTITDAAGCTADTSIVLTQPTPLIMSAQVDSSAGCNGASGGQISATPSGSVPAYSYAIDSTGAGVPTVFGTDSLWSNLSAGTYTVYVQDFNGCGPVSQLLTIGDDAPITTITSVLTPFNGQAIACNGDSTATATVASTGGSVGIHFIYQWDTNAASQTGTTATGLAAGVYFVTITDTVSTCTDIAQVTVNEPSLVSVNIDTVVNVDCYGQATGAVQVSGLGGTPSYTYSIDYPASQSPLGTFVGLPEGNYSITTTDANTCTATVTVSITDPDSLAIDLDTVNVSCFGLSDGAITAVVSGGTPFSTGYGYSVTWSPAASGAIDTLASLTAGSYTMTVQDARGCVATATAAVIEPTPIVVATDSLVPATCADTNGLLVLTASGGPSQLNGTLNNFEYSIDGGLTFQSSPVFNNLASGFYDIVVRDLGYTQCIGVYAVDLGSNSNITGTVDVSNESCFGYADGTASVFTSSTAGGYTYEWFTSVSSTVISTDQTATGLDGNIVPNTTGDLDTNFIYIVQVTDADGCVYTDSAYIESPDSLVVTASLVADVSCYGGADGMLNATVSGRDSLEVDYLWSNGATTAMSTGFTATPPDTIYTITITDSVGCNASDDIVISQPELPLAAFMTGSTVSCTDSTDGVITVDSIGGGTLPYLYSYSVVGPYGSDAILTQGLGAGIYTVYVQDGNGCTDSVENIVIRDTLDYIVTAFQDATINMGETVDLYGTVNNSDVDSSLVSWSMLDPNTGIISSLFTGTAALEGFTPDTFYTDMQFILALNNGCGDTSVVEILVNQEQTVYIPNGFSPNGDGYNDIFTVYGSTDVEKVKTFMVFDRWGELVHLGQDFEPGSTDPVNGWDGKFRGKPMNPTVLVYYAEIILVNGETVIRKGDVTLVK